MKKTILKMILRIISHIKSGDCTDTEVKTGLP